MQKYFRHKRIDYKKDLQNNAAGGFKGFAHNLITVYAYDGKTAIL